MNKKIALLLCLVSSAKLFGFIYAPHQSKIKHDRTRNRVSQYAQLANSNGINSDIVFAKKSLLVYIENSDQVYLKDQSGKSETTYEHSHRENASTVKKGDLSALAYGVIKGIDSPAIMKNNNNQPILFTLINEENIWRYYIYDDKENNITFESSVIINDSLPDHAQFPDYLIGKHGAKHQPLPPLYSVQFIIQPNYNQETETVLMQCIYKKDAGDKYPLIMKADLFVTSRNHVKINTNNPRNAVFNKEIMADDFISAERVTQKK